MVGGHGLLTAGLQSVLGSRPSLLLACTGFGVPLFSWQGFTTGFVVTAFLTAGFATGLGVTAFLLPVLQPVRRHSFFNCRFATGFCCSCFLHYRLCNWLGVKFLNCRLLQPVLLHCFLYYRLCNRLGSHCFLTLVSWRLVQCFGGGFLMAAFAVTGCDYLFRNGVFLVAGFFSISWFLGRLFIALAGLIWQHSFGCFFHKYDWYNNEQGFCRFLK